MGLTAEHKEEQGYSSAGTGAGHTIYTISDSEDDNDAITATNTCTKDNTGTGAGVIESQSDRLWAIINKQSHTIEDEQQTDIIRIGPNRSKGRLHHQEMHPTRPKPFRKS